MRKIQVLKNIVIFMNVKTLTWKCYVIQNYLNCKTIAKNNPKRGLLLQINVQEATMLLFHHFSVKTDSFQSCTFPTLFYLFNFIFSEFCYILIKNWQSYKEKLFFAGIEIFTIVSNIFGHVLNQFSKHMESCYYCINRKNNVIWYWQRGWKNIGIIIR